MLIPKNPRIKSKKLQRAAMSESCVMCHEDQTVVLAHLPDKNSGMGLKCHDFIGGHLCYKCHEYADNEGRADYKWRYLALTRTLERLFRRDIIKVA